MATIRSPTIRSGDFLTVDDVQSIFESTRASVDTLSDRESSTEVLSGSSLCSEIDDSASDSAAEETSTSGSSPTGSGDDEYAVISSDSEVPADKTKETPPYFLRSRTAKGAKRPLNLE